ncbi:uncharacterized protein LOC108883154 isoform X1 [Lates calcarifer]|uniref:Uncharacterized protein LOC108883154 isoform X1 n=1 Tax=Lates calcarifer TaxID=8187 RepID=A0AAJ7LTB4_LATCA|nr:uncharacterized protein LOC108883154 isoform X1 [Lates calcarifer]
MNLHHVLFFCFFSALCGGNSGINIYTGPEGGSGTINCHFTLPGNRKFFCKNECKGEDILVQTDDVRANRGRYSIEYKGESSGRGIVSMTIRNLTQSDSGTQYRCGLGGSLVPDSFWDFEVRVSDELLDKNSGLIQTDTERENVTYSCIDAVNRDRIFFCKGECKKEEDILIETDKNRAQSGRYSIEYKEGSTFGLYVTITQVVKSDSGQYRCGYGRALSPDSSRTFSVIVVDAPTTSKPTWTHRPSSTSVPSASTPPPIISSPGHSTPSSVLPETTNQPAAAASTTSKAKLTLQPFSTSVPSASTPPPIISSSGHSTPSSVLPENTNQPAAAGSTTSKPKLTLRPFSLSIPSASTPTPSMRFSSRGFTPSSVLPETTNQPAAAGSTTSKPKLTLRPFSLSVPSASTPTPTLQSMSFSSRGFTTISFLPETTNQPAAACTPHGVNSFKHSSFWCFQASTTSKLNRTLLPFSASIPSATTATSHRLSTTSSVFPVSTDQSASASQFSVQCLSTCQSASRTKTFLFQQMTTTCCKMSY